MCAAAVTFLGEEDLPPARRTRAHVDRTPAGAALRLWLRHKLPCLFVVPGSADGPLPLAPSVWRLAFGALGDWVPTGVDLLDLARCRGSYTALLARSGGWTASSSNRRRPSRIIRTFRFARPFPPAFQI